MLDIDYATVAAKSILMDEARHMVTARRWTGRPGDGWLLDGTGFPQTFGAHGQAVMFVNSAGTAYEVKLYDGDGNDVRSEQRKTLDAAFNAGLRMVRRG
jgi:hypothetical protein